MTGRIVQVNVSPGGVPKLPVGSARIGRLGLEGDGHNDRTEHGGPHRAVCLYTTEAIARLRAEGHRIGPGALGENLTLEGVELGDLRPGDRLAVGAHVVLEIASPCSPCATIRGAFSDGRIARVSVDRHPRDSRLYARVLREGIVRPGDPVTVLPPLPDSQAATHALLDRLDANERTYALATWRAAIEGGIDIRVLDDGDLAAAATPGVPEANFNTALGLRQLPHLVPEVLDHFRVNRVIAWLDCAEPPWDGAVPEGRGSVLAGEPAAVLPAPQVPGLAVRQIGPDDAVWWERIVVAGFGMDAAVARAWLAAAPELGRNPRLHLLVAELDGDAVAGAGLYVHHHVGGLGPASVLPEARGRGIHAALIAARARLGEELGCDMLTATAALGGQSERNMLRMGLRRVWERNVYRFDPATSG